MTAPTPIRRALVSVSDKTHLEVLAQILIDSQVEVLSTGGTYQALEALGVAVVKVSEYTGAPEILGGRVKTLHPKIHGGILALPTPAHEAELRLHGIAPIDLVVVNLYPFRQVVAKPGSSFEDAVENIDIGGPAMVRAAAKNWQRVAVVVDPADYARVGEALREHGGALPESLRRSLMRKAYAHTAAYDAAIAGYLARYDDTGLSVGTDALPDRLFVAGAAQGELRYGENPHQPARFYASELAASEPAGLHRAVQHQGKALSYNNLLDADAALGLCRDLSRLGPAAAVIKHVSPCGAAIARGDESLADVYVRAREADAESAFGGIVALSGPVDRAVAERLAETFLEVVIAPSFRPEALALLASKKNLRLLSLEDMLVGTGPDTQPALRLRSIAGGLLAQREDAVTVAAGQGKVATRRAPTASELRDLELAQIVGKAVRSNAIVLCKDGATVGIGGGQTSRVEAARQATARAGQRAQGAVLASDAFFPFRDGVDAAAAAGVTAIVQPGGSVRDEEVVTAADEHGLAMVFTGQRHFRH
ncbi:bifunctional phosphoribosylaminoimidazolecarboxamide formyltransferase/IMP cyclohydrolase [Nannocystis sp. ILAH1]|uniref:bifunctional phosphoribosylaminoimidazolecarboxamide formyltransferase/IMP cyclohydrolase n=1 Tax=Nannocystis sp. ILAH1 TaxID=2996789 RepID=UPI00226E72BB|nr:bifunctional phosphoribosylaminoimidazolecarboxamide formyltransferase/IMP cyclohydrolase [Nannocystis sp. ILAH1]MCY0986120.1 bifunctional phosphoribosylaminoimidazolecarboxamide formyltransferase/IMP cyclohydrolase [Nannocystis sp. ILAH1]